MVLVYITQVCLTKHSEKTSNFLILINDSHVDIYHMNGILYLSNE